MTGSAPPSVRPPADAPSLLVVGSFVRASCWQVARLPRADDSVPARGFEQEDGGKGLAVALGGHRLGSPVDLVLAIGSDRAGDDLLLRLGREGLPVRHIVRVPGASGHGAGLIDADGNTVVVVHAGANALLHTGALAGAADSLRRARVVYGQWEAPPATVAHALGEARRHGALAVLNPSPWQALPDDMLAGADILVANRRETAALLGLDALDGDPPGLRDRIARALPALHRRWTGAWLVVTLGPHGCIAFDRAGGVVESPPFPIADVPCPIGAGDAFSAGLCHALLQGQPLPRALRMANACGALAAGRAGILAALPTRDEVRRLLNPAA